MVDPFDEKYLAIESPAMENGSGAEATPVNGVKFGHCPAMMIAEVGFLGVVVIEVGGGSTDVSYLGRDVSVDGLVLDLQRYIGSWREGNKLHRSERELGGGVGEFV